jgi:hypothetical protein
VWESTLQPPNYFNKLKEYDDERNLVKDFCDYRSGILQKRIDLRKVESTELARWLKVKMQFIQAVLDDKIRFKGQKKDEVGKCLVSSLCSLNLKDIYDRGHTQIGIIFNTDVSTGPGKHWVALFCDIGPEFEYPRITYFDSYSHKPEKEIQILMQRWRDQWLETGIHKTAMMTTFNKTRHQYEDSECGMYCLYFHFCCLLGIPMEERIPDPVVRGFRSMLFRVDKK